MDSARIQDGLRVRLKTACAWWSKAVEGTGPPEKDAVIPEGAAGTLRQFIHGSLWLTMTDDAGKTKPYLRAHSAVYPANEQLPEGFKQEERHFGIEFDEHPDPRNQPDKSRIHYCRIVGSEGDLLPDYLEPE